MNTTKALQKFFKFKSKFEFGLSGYQVLRAALNEAREYEAHCKKHQELKKAK